MGVGPKSYFRPDAMSTAKSRGNSLTAATGSFFRSARKLRFIDCGHYDECMNLGFPEMIFLFLLALIIFGPKKLPEIGRHVGRALNEFKRASNEFRSQIEAEINQLDVTPKQEILPPVQAPAGAVTAWSGSGLQPELLNAEPVPPPAHSEMAQLEAAPAEPASAEAATPAHSDPEVVQHEVLKAEIVQPELLPAAEPDSDVKAPDA
jgi:TatA/E family protein of Tat protein translocase